MPNVEPRLGQRIHFCEARDGTRIAYAVTGEGYPLVRAAHYLSHLEFDYESPVWSHWIRELSKHNTYVRYDERGCGLSDWSPRELTFDSFVTDLETVVDSLGLKRFALLGVSQGGPVGIAYAVRHPERVSHLILCGSFALGWRKQPAARADSGSMARWESVLQLVESGWGRENPAFRQLFTSLMIPDASSEQVRSFNELQRVTCPPGNAVRFLELFAGIDVVELLPKLSVPTLILHARHDGLVPFGAGRALASRVPAARFVPFEGRNHIILESEDGWKTFVREVRAFLGPGVEPGLSPNIFQGPEEPSESETRSLLVQMNSVSLSSFSIVGSYVRYSPRVRNSLKDWKQRTVSALMSSRPGTENFLIWGSPGSGKSYLVQELSRAQGDSFHYTEINLAECDESTFRTQLASTRQGTKPCLCLVDEVDSKPAETWPYERLLPHLSQGSSRSPMVNVLAGSSASGLEEMKQRIAARPKGVDLLSRIPSDNELVVPGLDPGDSALVVLAQLRRAGAKAGRPVNEVEKLALYYTLLAPRFSSARQLGEFARQCVERLPPAEDRVKYDHLFRAGDPENKAFWNRVGPLRSELADSFVSLSD